jgi:SAM-dependent methyltransferase
LFTLKYLAALRAAEIEQIVHRFRPPGARVLEIGAGTGQQALEISRLGFRVDAIEIFDPASMYKEARVFPINDYDGKRIPFEDDTFDIVFSSNVLEHVPDLESLNREIARVLRPEGYCIHVMPTHSWRFWSMVTEFPASWQYVWGIRGEMLPRNRAGAAELRRAGRTWGRAALRLFQPFLPRAHGARGNGFSELWRFRPAWWRDAFGRHGFEVLADEPTGIFYTGSLTLGERLGLRHRRRLSKVLGSACHLFEVRPMKRPKTRDAPDPAALPASRAKPG